LLCSDLQLDNKVNDRLILASGSPRRRDMLRKVGLEFDVIPSPAEELHDESMALDQLCEENARLKALAVAQDYPEATVIGADTLVYVDQTPLGKPHSKEEAEATLMRLSGRTHQVCTGVCIARAGKVVSFHTITEVVFKKLSGETIKDYMSKVDVMDKAGSYAVQEHREMIVEQVRGDYDNVVGLPVAQLLAKL